MIWNEQCQEAFKKIKNYLVKPPILVPPVPKKPLFLYLITINTVMGALLSQYLEESRKENAIYYVKQCFTTILCWLLFRAKFECNFAQSYVLCILCGISLYGLCVRESVKTQGKLKIKGVFASISREDFPRTEAMCLTHDWNVQSHDRW